MLYDLLLLVDWLTLHAVCPMSYGCMAAGTVLQACHGPGIPANKVHVGASPVHAVCSAAWCCSLGAVVALFRVMARHHLRTFNHAVCSLTRYSLAPDITVPALSGTGLAASCGLGHCPLALHALLATQMRFAVCKRVGGGFGGKVTRPSAVAIPAALAAQKTGRPVRYVLTRNDDFRLNGGSSRWVYTAAMLRSSLPVL